MNENCQVIGSYVFFTINKYQFLLSSSYLVTPVPDIVLGMLLDQVGECFCVVVGDRVVHGTPAHHVDGIDIAEPLEQELDRNVVSADDGPVKRCHRAVVVVLVINVGAQSQASKSLCVVGYIHCVPERLVY